MAKRVGGPNACQVKANSKPWMVVVGQHPSTCSGTLIAKRVVLTAAHCIKRWHITGSGSITVGEHDKKKIEDGDQVIKVKSARIHEKWPGTRASTINILGSVRLISYLSILFKK